MKRLLGAIKYIIHKQSRTVHIVVGQHTTDEDGRIHLTPELISEGEIDTHIEFLKNDLDEAGRLAKKALKRERAKPTKLFE